MAAPITPAKKILSIMAGPHRDALKTQLERIGAAGAQDTHIE